MGLVDPPLGAQESTCLGDYNTKRVCDFATTPCAACGAFLPGAWVHTLHYRPSLSLCDHGSQVQSSPDTLQSLVCSAIWSLVAKSCSSGPSCRRLLCSPVEAPGFPGHTPLLYISASSGKDSFFLPSQIGSVCDPCAHVRPWL